MLNTLDPRSAAALAALVVLVASCTKSGEDSDTRDTAADAATEAPSDAATDASYACTPRSGCDDIEREFLQAKACCSPITDCGYELPELDDATRMWFPQVEDQITAITGERNGRCAPESHYFSPQPGLWKHRVEVDDGEDILVTPDCEAYSILAFILPGCCLPDNRCGYSTDESWPSFETFVNGESHPFTRPECVSPAELNEQFRDSGTLEPFARIPEAAGQCDYAALDQELPDKE